MTGLRNRNPAIKLFVYTFDVRSLCNGYAYFARLCWIFLFEATATGVAVA
jgi:hypothetical protein